MNYQSHHLTEEMTQLCAKIALLREKRTTLLNELAEGRDELVAGTRSMLADFRDARVDATRKVKTELHEFSSGLRNVVSRWRKDFGKDLAGQRQAFSGREASPVKLEKVP